MANPSALYAVDATETYGTTTVNLTKDLSTLFPTLNGQIDNTISINRFENDIVKNIYAKSNDYNAIYDDSITFTEEPDAPGWVWKYYKRTSYPKDTVLINNAIVYGSTGENRVYAIGVKEDAESIYNYQSAGNLKFIRDLDYNKIIYECYATEYSNFTLLPKGTIQEGISDHPTPTMTDVELNEVDADKWYLGFNHRAGHIWNGSGWSNIYAKPIYICNGETVQSIQSAGKSFYSSINQYSATVRTGENIDISVSANNNLNYGYNYHNRMDRNGFTLGWNNSINTAPNWVDIPGQMIDTIRQWFIDNSIPTGSGNKHWFLISSEIKTVSNDMGMLVTVIGQFYLKNETTIHCSVLNEMFYPMVKGSTILQMLAGFGCYYVADNTVDLSETTPDALGDNAKIWLGAMSADGTTNGTWIKGNDINNYHGYNKDGDINNPDYDPSGGGGGGGPYEDDPWHGVDFSGVGVGGAGAFAKVYYMTSTELANLRSWMNSISVPEGFDPMAQIVGLSQVPVALSGSSSENVTFVNSSAVYDPGVTTRAVDTGVSTQQSMGTPIRYSLGSVNITRRMQERGEPYLDYDCQIELYLPLIGMFSLDTQAVMGRTIYADAVLDPISGTLAAYAYVSKDGQNLPVAYGSTTIGVDLPISAQQYSVARAALKQANAQLGTSILSSTLSLIAATTAGGKGSGAGAKTSTGSNGLAAAGIREAGADYMKASQAGNIFGDFMQWGRTIRQLSYGNNTAIGGSFGGSTAQWSYPFTPYVKINRPRFEKPSNYAHSQGVPCVEAKTVGSCTGFIQCIGVDVSSITNATDLERQAIQAALCNGVFAGGGV